MTALTFLFRRLAWALARDDLEVAFYRAKVSALAFFVGVWLPVLAVTLLLPLPRAGQDMALLASFPVTGAVFHAGLRRAAPDGPPAARPVLDAATRRSLVRLGFGYGAVLIGLAAVAVRLA